MYNKNNSDNLNKIRESTNIINLFGISKKKKKINNNNNFHYIDVTNMCTHNI